MTTMRAAAMRFIRGGMSADTPINLNKARKARSRAAARDQAARNRVVHGRTKAEKAATEEARKLADLRLDGALREP